MLLLKRYFVWLFQLRLVLVVLSSQLVEELESKIKVSPALENHLISIDGSETNVEITSSTIGEATTSFTGTATARNSGESTTNDNFLVEESKKWDQHLEQNHVTRRRLRSLDEAYRDKNIRLPDSVYNDKISASDHGVPTDVVITTSATDVILSDIQTDKFTVQLDASINVRLQPQPQQQDQQHPQQQQRERTFVIDGFNAEVSLNNNLDGELFQEFNHGTFLSPKQFFPCLLGVAYDSTRLISVTMGELRNAHPPEEEAAATRKESSAVEALTSTQGLPYIAGTTIRSLVDDLLVSFINQSRCPDMIAGKFYLDFRDFFLAPQEALDLGGTGLQPYGDTGQILYSGIQFMLQPKNGINDVIELNAYYAQSYAEGNSCMRPVPGAEHGTYHITGELYSDTLKFENFSLLEFSGDFSNVDIPYMSYLNGEFINITVATISGKLDKTTINYGLSDLKLLNVDTLTAPTMISHPTNESYVIANLWNFGPATSEIFPVTLSLRGFIDIAGRFPEHLQNLSEVELMLSADSVAISSKVIALMSPRHFFQFPLGDILNMCCWFALTSYAYDDLQTGDDFEDQGTLQRSFEFKSLEINITNLTPNVTCIHCKSSGLQKAASSVTRILNVSDVRTVLANRTSHFLNELFDHKLFQNLVDALQNDTKKLCPHIPGYTAEKFNMTMEYIYDNMNYPDLSTEGHDSLTFFSLLGLQSLIVAFTDVIHEHRNEWNGYASHRPLSGETLLENLHLPEDTELVDWTNIEHPLISWLYGEFRSRTLSLGARPENVTLNFWMEQFFKLDDGVYVISFRDRVFKSVNTRVTLHETNITLTEIRIGGLNSFTYVNILNATDPQIFENVVNMELVSLQFIVEVTTPDFETLEISWSSAVEGVNVTVPIFCALDKNLLSSLKVRNFIFIKDIFWCLLTTMHGFEYLRVDVEVGDIKYLRVDGFLPDTSQAMAQSVEVILEIMQSKTKDLFHFVFELLGDIANEVLATSIEMSRCPNHTEDVDVEYVDFRQMLSRNVTSNSTTGDLFFTLKELFNAAFFSPYNETSNEPMINEKLLVPVTKTQSGEKGRLNLFKGDRVFESSEISGPLGFKVYSMAIENVDTFGLPMVILDANETYKYSVNNNVSIGVREPLKVSFEAENAFTSMSNKARYYFEFYNVSLFLVWNTTIRVRDLVELPFEHILNDSCWAQVFTSVNGPVFTAVDGEEEEKREVRIGIDYLDLKFENFTFNMTCLECNYFSQEELPDFFYKIRNVLFVVFNRLKDVIVEISNSGLFDAYILHQAQKCPLDWGLPNLPKLMDSSDYLPPPSDDALESVMYFGYVLTIIVTKFVSNHYATFDPESFHNPTAGQAELPEEIIFVNFTSESLNPLHLAEKLSPFGGSKNDSVKRSTHDLISKYLFPDGSVDILDITNTEASFGDTFWRIDYLSLRVTGLDTLTEFKLEYPGSQIIQSQYRWEKFGLHFVTQTSSVGSDSTRKTYEQEGKLNQTVSISFDNLTLSSSLLMAIEEDKFLSMKLGSILKVDNFFPCLFNISHALNLTEFFATASRLNMDNVEGYGSKELNDSLKELNRIMQIEYNKNLNEYIPAVTDVLIRELFSEMLHNYSMSQPLCDGTGSNSFSEISNDTNTTIDANDKSTAINNTIASTSTFNDTNTSNDTITIKDTNATGTNKTNHTNTSDHSNASDHSNTTNDNITVEESFIDLRDLLLSETDSRTYGGSGTAPYGHWFNYLYQLVDILELDADGKRSSLNDLDLFASHYEFPGELLNISGDFGRGYFIFVISDLKIDNIDSLGAPMSLLDLTPDFPYNLNNTISFGVDEKPLFVSFELIFDFEIDERRTCNRFYFNVTLDSLSLQLDSVIRISFERFTNLTVLQMFNGYCWYNCIHNLGIHNLSVTAKKVNVNSTRISCNGIGADTFLSDTASTSLTSFFNNFWRFILPKDGSQFAQGWIDKYLQVAEEKCLHQEFLNSSATKAGNECEPSPVKSYMNEELYGITFFMVSFVAVFVICSIYVRYSVQKRSEEGFNYLTEYDIFSIQVRQRMEEALQNELNMETRCMFLRHNDIPLFVRYGFPIVLLGSIGLFMIADRKVVSMITFHVQVAGEDYHADDAFDLMKGGNTKGALIPKTAFTLLFQYLKQAITFALWFVSPAYISTSFRGSTLYWLGALAKWSMFKVMFFITFAVGLRIMVPDPKLSLMDNLPSISVSLCPHWGLCLNLIAQLISQLSSNVAFHYHNKIVEGVTRKYEHEHKLRPPLIDGTGSTEVGEEVDIVGVSENVQQFEIESVASGAKFIERVDRHENEMANEDRKTLDPDNIYGDRKDGLYNHAFIRLHKCRSEKVIVRISVNILIILLMIMLLIFIFLAFYLPIFSFETQGFLGYFEMIGKNFDYSRDAYSVHDIAVLLWNDIDITRGRSYTESSENAVKLSSIATFIGFSSLAALLYATLLLIPFAHLVVLVYQWFVPMTGKSRRRLLAATGILQAYSYYEVFILSIIVLTWQLDTFPNKVLTALCCEITNKFLRYGLLKDKSARCFGRVAVIEVASYIMIASFSLLCLLKTYVTKASEQYFLERDEWAIANDDLPESITSDECKPFPVMFTDVFRWTLRDEPDPSAFVHEREGDDDIRKICDHVQEPEWEQFEQQEREHILNFWRINGAGLAHPNESELQSLQEVTEQMNAYHNH